MKNISKLCFVFGLVVLGLNTAKAQTSLKDDESRKAAEVKGLIKDKDYVFEAKNDMSLNHRRYVAISKDTLIAYLPGYLKGDPIKFATTSFAYNVSKTKRGGWDVVIRPNTNMSDIKELKMDIMPSGRASLRVIGNHGPLSVNGYIKQEDY
jgi:hypothetical protein